MSRRMSGRHMRWAELTRRQRAALVAASCVEAALTVTSLVDLARRPAAQVRGAKAWWVLAVFVQPVGPVAYLTVGRRTGRPDLRR